MQRINSKLILSCIALVLLIGVASAFVVVKGDDLFVSGNAVVTGNLQVDGNFTRYNPHATVYDLTTQTMAAASTNYTINFSGLSGYQISLTNGKNISVEKAGYYSFAVSAIFSPDTNNKYAELWFRINGTDVPNSNTRMVMPSAVTETPMAVTLTLYINPTDWVNVVMATDDAGTQLVTTGATAYSPATPSIIIEMFKISS